MENADYIVGNIAVSLARLEDDAFSALEMFAKGFAKCIAENEDSALVYFAIQQAKSFKQSHPQTKDYWKGYVERAWQVASERGMADKTGFTANRVIELMPPISSMY